VRHVYLPPLRDAKRALASGNPTRIYAPLNHFLDGYDPQVLAKALWSNDALPGKWSLYEHRIEPLYGGSYLCARVSRASQQVFDNGRFARGRTIGVFVQAQSSRLL
jgi:hypothetical protein